MASFLDKFRKPKAAAPASTSEQFDDVYERATSAATSRDFKKAIMLYDQAIALDPSRAEPYYKRGNAQKNIGKLIEAVASYDQAVERQPDYAFALCNRGVIQQALGLHADALSSYDRALAIDPSDPMVHYNRALLLQDMMRWDEAIQSYDRAVAVNPTYADAHFNRSMALLYCGQFELGWRGYEWRWKHAQRLGIGELRTFAQPLWLGQESIAGKRILIHFEAGLGDTLQFCRYVPMVAAKGGIVVLQVQEPLIDLLENLEGVSELVPPAGLLPPFDYHCPLMSLPLAFNTTVQTVPPPPAHFHADSAAVDRWQSQLRRNGRARVGLVWSGNPKNLIDPRRSIRLAEWVTRLPDDFDYFCLQKDVREADEITLDANPQITRFEDDELNFVDTAALCECMDVVISVDTSLAHLSGSLGRPTWVLLPFTPDWRWLSGRDDSPWYPSARLYRQSAVGDWCSVFDRVSADLRREFTGD